MHEEVLKDSVTVSTFQRARQRNEHLFRDKVVLDVGCGLGILSLLALKAGARKVVATETNRELISMAFRIALANGFGPTSSLSSQADPAT